MPDDMTAEQRSRTMSRIRSSRNLSTEARFGRLLWQSGIRGWRRRSTLVGRPDFVFEALRLAVFVDGCYWHQCPKCALAPKSNLDYWAPKLRRNVVRDRATTLALRRQGWSVMRVWEHELGTPDRVRARVRRILTRRMSALAPGQAGDSRTGSSQGRVQASERRLPGLP